MGTNVPRPTLRPPTPLQRRTNCPNCCAVITGPVCEYCGTRFEEYEERVIPIYMGNEQIGEVGNPARDVKSLSLPIKKQR